VRACGYGVNRGSYRDGVGGLAAPIRDHTGQVIASVGVCLPEQRFGEDRFDELRAATIEAAVDISAALGGPGQLVAATAHAKSNAEPVR
jgi:DNA-binding IclR family transcriptional regulator